MRGHKNPLPEAVVRGVHAEGAHLGLLEVVAAVAEAASSKKV